MLEELYEESGLSKLKFARALGVSVSTLQRMENGKFNEQKQQDIINQYLQRMKPDIGLCGNDLVRAIAKAEMAYNTLGSVLDDLRKTA